MGIKTNQIPIMGGYEMIDLNEYGVVATLGEKPRNGFLMFDFDDSLVNTTLGEKGMLRAIHKFICKYTDGKYSNDIISLSLELANSENNPGGKKIYYPEKQIHALCVMVSGLGDYKSFEGVKNEVLKINKENKLGILDENLTDKQSFSDARLAVETIFDSPDFTDMAEVIKILIEKSKDMEFGVGVFTFGDPVFQSEKVKRFVKRHSISFDEIWLTRSTKADFVNHLIESKYLDPECAILLADDNPKEIENIIQKNKSGKVSIVRLTREDIKYRFDKISDNIVEPIKSIDFTKNDFSPEETTNIILETFLKSRNFVDCQL